MKKKIEFRDVIIVLGIIICTILFFRYITSIISYYINKDNQKEVIQEVQLKRDIAKVDEKKIEGKASEEKDMQILQEYKSLYLENNDMYGWLKIEGTSIDAPVMYTPDNPYFYLNRNWNKEVCYGEVGYSLFIEGGTTQSTENIIIYGHNIHDNILFGSLKLYEDDEEFYKEHKIIEFDTLYEKQYFEIISVSHIIAYDEEQISNDEYSFYAHTELDSKEEFDEYVANAKAKSCYNIETTAEYGDQLITLSTCNNWTKNGRLILVAKKIT